ncbi:uncharacterized protein LY79DRAFT_583139 [Colletotrichum navitas]|uniref:Uncharacterized protein n=1 Tax=Colletotrichum navitas TaxID=681940 RepID=A0AAD8UZY4_9PEZI|nr:uncharacterized protein LY79DRAFT_583139 [Colletotrichum navitas]KAK1574182.1 hypothetical protein LY79DRAFT_583139 [Colletotrichum navitas]
MLSLSYGVRVLGTKAAFRFIGPASSIPALAIRGKEAVIVCVVNHVLERRSHCLPVHLRSERCYINIVTVRRQSPRTFNEGTDEGPQLVGRQVRDLPAEEGVLEREVALDVGEAHRCRTGVDRPPTCTGIGAEVVGISAGGVDPFCRADMFLPNHGA